jgi:V/A-type H+-transporting ATPase subunit G/H
MALEQFKIITEAESEAAKIRSEAVLQAKKIISDARKQGEEIVAQAISDSKREMADQLALANEQAQTNANAIAGMSLQESEKLKSDANINKDKAVAYIIERTVKG